MKEYTPLEMEEAIVYASANVRGGALQYNAYLDKTLKNQWAAGYLEQSTSPSKESLLANYGLVDTHSSPGGFAGAIPGRRYPNGTIMGSVRMDSNLMACQAFINEEE